MIFEFDHKEKQLYLTGYSRAEKGEYTQKGVRNAYISEAVKDSNLKENEQEKIDSFFLGAYRGRMGESDEDRTEKVFAGKKYKPVALKVKPVYTELPDKYQIKRQIQGDPLAEMPKLNPRPPEFELTGRYTQEGTL